MISAKDVTENIREETRMTYSERKKEIYVTNLR